MYMQNMVKSSHTSQKFVPEAFPEIRKYFNTQNKPAIRYVFLLLFDWNVCLSDPILPPLNNPGQNLVDIL